MGLLSGLFKGGNFGLVARNVTYIYERTKTEYGKYFSDEKSILRTTAFIDLFTYIRLGQISITMINELINGLRDEISEYDTPGCFNDFVFQLEKMIFSVDSPRNAWLMDDDASIFLMIMENIRKTKAKIEAGKLRKPQFDRMIHDVFNSPNQEEMHQALGISKP